MRKTQGDATKRDLREGSRGDDFSRGQKRARHFRNNAVGKSLARWLGRPIARHRNQRGAGPRKRQKKENEKEKRCKKGNRKDEGSETSKIERKKEREREETHRREYPI